MNTLKKKNSLFWRRLSFITFTIFYIVALNPDLTNQFYLWHGVQALVVGVCLIQSQKMRKDIYLKWIFGYYLLLIVSVIWATNLSAAFSGVFSFAMIQIPIFFMHYWVRDDVDFKICILSVLLGLVINGVYAVYVAGWFNYIGVDTPGLYYWAANATSRRYAIGVVFALFLLKDLDSKRNKALIIGCLVLFSYVLIYCGSRGALILVATSLLVTIGVKDEPNWKKVAKMIISIGAVIVLYNVFLNNDMLYAIIGKRFDRFNRNYAMGGIAGAETERINMIKSGMDLFLKRPILGYSYDGFRANTSFNKYSHNDYIEILVELGLIGFFVFYSIYFFMISKAKILCKKINKKDYSLFVGCFLGLIIFNFVSITRYDVVVQTFISFYILCIDLRYGKIGKLKAGR